MSPPRKMDQVIRTFCSLAAFALMTIGACFYFASDAKLELQRPMLVNDLGTSAMLMEAPLSLKVNEEYGWRLKASGILSVIFGVLMFAGCFLGEKKPAQQ